MEYRTLPCDLTDEEIRRKSDVVASKIEERDDIETRRKSSADAFKEQMKEIDGQIKSLAREIRTRKEDRTIPCQWERDEAQMLMCLVRQDTGEVVQSRPMYETERQVPLFAGASPSDAAPPSESGAE